MKLLNFVGFDVSKNTLDISIVTDGKIKYYQQIANSTKSINKELSQMLKEYGASMDDSVFCIEHTGMYSMLLVKWLNSKGAKIWIETSQQIRWSSGLIRGKTDKIDSGRIALYAFKNQQQMRVWKAPTFVLEKISALLAQRTRLVKAKRQLSVAFKEQKGFYEKDIVKSLEKYVLLPVKVLQQQIEQIEKELVDTLKSDEHICRLYKIIISVDGIGPITAAYMLVATNQFLSITDPKKFACYSGVVPFEHFSGTSIRKKTRVSHRANKTIKTLLHMSAISAIQAKGDLRDYYLRKVEEGKNKMSVINAVRNKLVLRVFSCVKRGCIYDKNYIYKVA